jgi:hypothetical protein
MLKLKNTPEQVELIRALGSKDQVVAAEASEAFAAFLGPVIEKVIAQASTSGMIFNDSEFDEDDSPSYPLDLYYNENEGYISVWSQSMAGGMPTAQVEGVKEMKISTYRIDSAVSWMKKYARKSRLDIVSKALERMAQEVLLKQERNAWAVILRALAEATTTGSGAPLAGSHVINTGSLNSGKSLNVADMSRLMTLMRRLGASWAGGTPTVDSYGLTDMFVSPEIKEDIRGFAYNAVNEIGSTSVPLPDNLREGIFRSAGMSELYGVRIHDLLELGHGQKYNKLFTTFASGKNLIGGSAAFTDVGHQILIGVDGSRGAFIRPVARQHDSGGTFSVMSDDQFNVRADKVGFWGFLEEGRVCIDSRAIAGLTVKS